MSDLHGQIMNLPAKAPDSFGIGAQFEQCYKVGHRDARHAAAELAAAHLAALRALADEFDRLAARHGWAVGAEPAGTASDASQQGDAAGRAKAYRDCAARLRAVIDGGE